MDSAAPRASERHRTPRGDDAHTLTPSTRVPLTLKPDVPPEALLTTCPSRLDTLTKVLFHVDTIVTKELIFGVALAALANTDVSVCVACGGKRK